MVQASIERQDRETRAELDRKLGELDVSALPFRSRDPVSRWIRELVVGAQEAEAGAVARGTDQG
jgi:hypothetical protein